MARISNFRGLISDADAGDVPEGSASSQKNVSSHRPGMLIPRKGIQPASLSSAVQIDSGYNMFQRMAFCKTRIGWVVGVNGVDRGFIWDGVNQSATFDLGVDEPVDGPTITTAALNNFAAISGSDNAIKSYSAGDGQYHLTITGHGFVTGDKIYIGGVEGSGALLNELNGEIHKLTRINDNEIYLDDTTFSGTYTDGTGQWAVAEKKRDLSGTALTASSATTKEILVAHTAHGLTTGDHVTFSGVRGTGFLPGDVNGQVFKVTVTDANNFSLDNSHFDGAYTDATGSFTRLGEGMVKGEYICVYRYKTSSFPPQYSSISVNTYVDALAVDKFTWSNIQHSASTRIGVIELFRTTANQGTLLYKVGEIANTPGASPSSFTDVMMDRHVSAKVGDEVLPFISSNNDLVARRFQPPPDHFKYCIMFQDRYFYFGTVKYNKGTLSVSDGSATVTGSGTDWVSTFKGRYLQIAGSSKLYLINSASATQLTLDETVTGTFSGASYTILPSPSTKRQILFSYQDEPESVPATNSITLQSNHGDDDEIVGAMPYGPFLYILSSRHKYSFSYSSNPLTDGAVRFLDDRGSFNNQTWAIYENEAYIMDDAGVYVFDGTESESISKPIQDIFRQDGSIGSLDYAKKEQFFLKLDRLTGRVYCFVCFVGDSGTYPTRALVYNIRRKTWDLMHYPVQISDAASIESNGVPRVIVSSENEKVFLLNEGTTDVITSEITGTVTASGNNTLTDSTASWTSSALVGASVYITDGTGKGQRRTIQSNSSTGLILLTNWTTNPDTTSKYSIGAIEWNWKSGSFGFAESGSKSKREFSMKFKPTTNAVSVDVRSYYNGKSTPLSYAVPQELGDAVQIKEDNKEDVVINMGTNYSDLEESSGREKFRFDGMYSYSSHGDHKVSFEVRGHSGAESQEIQMIEIQGVDAVPSSGQGGQK